MHRTVRHTFAALLIFLLTACAPALTPSAAPTPAVPTAAAIAAPATATASQAAALVFARPQGEAGTLLAYDPADGALRFSLPAGLLSADRQHYLATQTDTGTQLLNYDLRSGAATPLLRLAGRWELSTLSATGRWAMLTRLASDSEKQAWTARNAWQTEMQLVDTTTGKPAPAIVLDGNFVVDALSPEGEALYIIQYLPAVKPDHYQVRWFDLSTRSLQDGALADKREPDEVMVGQRQQAVASADGSWVFTLYLRTTNTTAFVHALSTRDKYTLCFDLPTAPGNTLDQLRGYTLALSPDGQRLYAANQALGLVATVDLSSYEVASAARFATAPAAQADATVPNFSVAADRALYFSGDRQIWAFDSATRQVKRLSTVDTPISGLALGGDGQQLFVARPELPLLRLDAASGATLSFQ